MKDVPTALNQRDRKKIAGRGADLIIGIPSLNCAPTISHVVGQAAKGLIEYFPDRDGLIFVSDGNSTDGTCDVAKATRTSERVDLFVSHYDGVHGKGTAIRAILECADALEAKGVALIDADVRSIKPEWVRLLLDPVLKGTGLVTPLYKRHKYDGTITNHVSYPITSALYGKDVRQPIGGDFGLSERLYRNLLKSQLWKKPCTSRFGVDTLITHSALGGGYEVKEAMLGVKIHRAKDPFSLTSMFREVVDATFTCMERYEGIWKRIKGLEPVPLVTGEEISDRHETVAVDVRDMVRFYKANIEQALCILSTFFPHDLIHEVERSRKESTSEFPLEAWIRILYAAAASFRRTDGGERSKLLNALRILWVGRVASFVIMTSDMADDEVETMVRGYAKKFAELKEYLLDVYPRGEP